MGRSDRAREDQRRRGRAVRLSVAAAVAVAVVVATAVVAGRLGTPTSTIGATRGSGSATVTPIRLVAYHGAQLEGFIVDQVPQGWYLQGSNAFRLTLAPRGDTTSADAFEGKLVVMLLSSSAPQKLPKGEPVEVGALDGVVTHSDDADTLTYEDGAGHLVQIQAWRAALRWTDEQLATFAEGVQVTSEAQAGVG